VIFFIKTITPIQLLAITAAATAAVTATRRRRGAAVTATVTSKIETKKNAIEHKIDPLL